MTYDKNIFIKNVEKLVRNAGISKQKFCDDLNFSRSSFVNWKRQSALPSADTVFRIADYFNVEPKSLFADVQSKNNRLSKEQKICIQFNALPPEKQELVEKLIGFLANS